MLKKLDNSSVGENTKPGSKMKMTHQRIDSSDKLQNEIARPASKQKLKSTSKQPIGEKRKISTRKSNERPLGGQVNIYGNSLQHTKDNTLNLKYINNQIKNDATMTLNQSQEDLNNSINILTGGLSLA